MSINLNTYYKVQTTMDGLQVVCPKVGMISIYAIADPTNQNLKDKLVKSVVSDNEIFDLGLPVGMYFKVVAMDGSYIYHTYQTA